MKKKITTFFNLHSLIFLALFIVGLYLTAIKIMGPNFDRIPGDMADSRLCNYFLEHGHLFFTGKEANYWNAPFMYPEKNVITYSENLLGTLPIYSALRFLNFNPESAFQGWIIILFALNFLAAVYALFKLSGNLAIASVGAYIFAFSMPIIAQMNHPQVFPRFIIPLVFLWLISFFKTQKIKYFSGLILGIVFQFYACIYLGFLLAFCVLICMIVFLFYVKQIKIFVQDLGWKKIFQIVGWGAISLALLIPLLYPYYERAKISGTRTYEEVINSIPYIRSYFFAWQGSYLWTFLTKTALNVPVWWDHFLFPGGIVVLCIILFVFIGYKQPSSDFKKGAIAIFISTLLILIFTLQFNGHSLYKFIYHIPGFSSMRAVGRIINVELFLFALIVTFSFTWIVDKMKYKSIFLLLIAALCIVDQYSTDTMGTYSKKDSQDRITAIEDKLKEKHYSEYNAFAYIPDDKKENNAFTHIDVMLASQSLNIQTVNAYTATSPGEFAPFFENLDSTTLNNWLLSRNIDVVKDKILLIK